MLSLLRILLMFHLFWKVFRKSLKQNPLLTLIVISFSSFISHFCNCLYISDTSWVWSKCFLISIFSSIILTEFSSSLLSGCLSKKNLFLFSKHKSACSSIMLSLNELLQIGQYTFRSITELIFLLHTVLPHFPMKIRIIYAHLLHLILLKTEWS